MNIDDNLCQKIIRSSLAYEKKLWKTIITSTTEGHSPVYKRILTNTEGTFKNLGYNINDFSIKSNIKWYDNLETLAKKCGLIIQYQYIYRTLCEAGHGSWLHLKNQYLQEEENQYEPIIRDRPHIPPLLTNINCLCVHAAAYYMKAIEQDIEFSIYIHKLLNWHQDIEIKYSEFYEPIKSLPD